MHAFIWYDTLKVPILNEDAGTILEVTLHITYGTILDYMTTPYTPLDIEF